MTISASANHPAPTPSRPCEYALFFIPRHMLPSVESFFAGLEEPDEHFLLVTAMRVEQLSWRPERIKRADVRALTHHNAGVWVALTEPQQAARLRAILGGQPPSQTNDQRTNDQRTDDCRTNIRQTDT